MNFVLQLFGFFQGLIWAELDLDDRSELLDLLDLNDRFDLLDLLDLDDRFDLLDLLDLDDRFDLLDLLDLDDRFHDKDWRTMEQGLSEKNESSLITIKMKPKAGKYNCLSRFCHSYYLLSA